MTQQLIAIVVVLFFIIKLLKQKSRQEVSGNEFLLWLFFWFFALSSIIFVKDLDSLLDALGFSANGIGFLSYLGIAVLFYFIFRLRIKIAKMDKQITMLTRKIAIEEAVISKKQDK